jgi:hypothetical protein
VNTTAINIPNADNRFPALAVSGDRSHNNPVMNSTDATMYAASVRLSSACEENSMIGV